MKKILIVDDSEVLRVNLKEALGATGAWTIVEAENGTDGCAKAQDNKDISLIITDLNMPEMDGITMMKKIRQIPEFEKTPAFMLTTEASPELKLSGKEVGIMLWMVKPFAADKLIGAIDKVIGR